MLFRSATIRTMRDDNLADRARHIESIALPRLRSLLGDVAIVGDVRGRGAMLAVEFVVPGSDTPNAAATKAIVEYCTKRGVVVISCGTFGNCVRLLPPLVITDDQLHDGLSVFEEAIRSVGATAS